MSLKKLKRKPSSKRKVRKKNSEIVESDLERLKRIIEELYNEIVDMETDLE